MCEPATIAAIGTWMAGAGGTAAATAGSYAAAAVGTAAGYGGLAAATIVPGAATAATAMTTAQMVSLGLSVASAGIGAVGAMNQASAAKAVAKNNAQNAELQAQDAQRRGEKDAQEIQRKAAAFKSSQRVNLASKGLDLTYGTAADLQDETDFFSQSDIVTTRNNAAKEAWAKRSQKAGFQAEAAASRPWLAGGSTLLAGGSQVADKWMQYRGR